MRELAPRGVRGEGRGGRWGPVVAAAELARRLKRWGAGPLQARVVEVRRYMEGGEEPDDVMV